MIYIGVLIIIISPPPPVESPAPPAPPAQPVVQEQPPMPRDPGLIWMSCPHCLWTGGYDNMTSAKLGRAKHINWCLKGHSHKPNLFG